MSIEPATPAFPRPESLARFFRMPPDALVPLAKVAELLGTNVRVVRSILRVEGAQPLDGSIRWTEAAAYLFDAWPRARILDALGPEAARVIPSEFLLTRVNWSLPIFIVRAMEHQAATAWRDDARVRASLAANHAYARGVEDYVADLLYNDISSATLGAFRNDKSFLRAFHYPVLD
ncbi:MAG TPA: hypothetical protein VE974_29715 [Thermoanaerobaculia bacterium]|nr:hypothetical protein [Thermoanaerobaculia bacterium]